MLESDGLTVSVDVDNSIHHPSFNYFFPRFGSDVCILKLTTSVDTNAYPPVNLNTDCCKPCDGDVLKIYGYGHVDKNFTKSTYLKTLDTTYQGQPSTDNVMYVLASPTTGACFGDSGGPAVLEDTQYGIASFVRGGCAEGNPDGYTRISDNYDWIRQQVCSRSVDTSRFDCCATGSVAAALRTARSSLVFGARSALKTMSSFMGFGAKEDENDDDWFYPRLYPDSGRN